MATKENSTVKKPSAKNPDAARPSAGPGPAAMAAQLADTEATAAAMPANATKAAEYGEDAGFPPAGETVKPASRAVTGSSLSEGTDTGKTGAPAADGQDPTTTPLDRVRVDASGQGLTTNQGVPVADNQGSLKAGLRGPALLKDFILREKITHFDHERIPERIVHARGSAAHGVFESYGSLKSLTRAAPFQEAGKQTPVFVRFSTVAGERGSKDTARDVRGFAVKFYTDEGNWDLVGNNMPVFFIQDAMKFPDLVHAVKPEPHNAMPQAASAHDTFWDFVSLMPESTHTLLWAMSDRGIPRSYRMMQGFGVHTFRFVNEAGEASLVKFHWKPLLGTHSLVWEEAVKISGCDPDFHRRDLWDAIESGAYPEWELGVQVFTEAQADAFSFDVLDATKLIPEELVPVTPIGRMVLNRNPDNFFAETEQVAFCTAHVVPGIDFTNDPLLAGRIHSYVDTQISRLGGPNFHELPINAPLAPVHNNQRDGMHRQAIHRGRVSYEPNSLAGGCPFQTGQMGFVPFPEPVAGDELRGKPGRFAEHYSQAQLFFDSQSAVEQAHIIAAFRFELSKVTVPAIRTRTLAMLRNVSDELAGGVAQGLGMDLPEPLPRAIAHTPRPEVKVSPALSLMALPGEQGVLSRKVAIMIADGVDGAAVARMQAALREEGAIGRLVGPRVGAFTAADGKVLEAEASFENEPSVLFDGLVLPGGEGAFAALGGHALVHDYIKDQYRHLKTILAMGTGVALLEGAGVPVDRKDAGLLVSAKGRTDPAAAFIDALAHHRHYARDRDPPKV
jgi:catalase